MRKKPQKLDFCVYLPIYDSFWSISSFGIASRKSNKCVPNSFISDLLNIWTFNRDLRLLSAWKVCRLMVQASSAWKSGVSFIKSIGSPSTTSLDSRLPTMTSCWPDWVGTKSFPETKNMPDSKPKKINRTSMKSQISPNPRMFFFDLMKKI